MIDLYSKSWRTLLYILSFIIKYFEAVEKKKRHSQAEIFVACYLCIILLLYYYLCSISFSSALNLGSFSPNFSPLSRKKFSVPVSWQSQL